MKVYIDLVIVLNFVVDLCLLLGTNRLAGHPLDFSRAALASGVGGGYAGACMLPTLRFLGSSPWRIVFLGIMSVIAFGRKKSAFRRGVLFVLLSMSLGGIAQSAGGKSIGALMIAAAGVCLLCVFGFRGRAGTEAYVPVQLIYKGEKMQLTALVDSGNLLRDPLSGERVLVAGSQAAAKLLGLSNEQLMNPVKTLSQSDSNKLRLIPYRTLSDASGLLLAARLDEVRMNGKAVGKLVAFAPLPFGNGEEYQALTGGEL